MDKYDCERLAWIGSDSEKEHRSLLNLKNRRTIGKQQLLDKTLLVQEGQLWLLLIRLGLVWFFVVFVALAHTTPHSHRLLATIQDTNKVVQMLQGLAADEQFIDLYARQGLAMLRATVRTSATRGALLFNLGIAQLTAGCHLHADLNLFGPISVERPCLPNLVAIAPVASFFGLIIPPKTPKVTFDLLTTPVLDSRFVRPTLLGVGWHPPLLWYTTPAQLPAPEERTRLLGKAVIAFARQLDIVKFRITAGPMHLLPWVGMGLNPDKLIRLCNFANWTPYKPGAQ